MVKKVNPFLFAILFVANYAFSQTRPTFDVASIKPHAPGQPPGRVGFNG
jgi:hypothetical protein